MEHLENLYYNVSTVNKRNLPGSMLRLASMIFSEPPICNSLKLLLPTFMAMGEQDLFGYRVNEDAKRKRRRIEISPFMMRNAPYASVLITPGSPPRAQRTANRIRNRKKRSIGSRFRSYLPSQTRYYNLETGQSGRSMFSSGAHGANFGLWGGMMLGGIVENSIQMSDEILFRTTDFSEDFVRKYTYDDRPYTLHQAAASGILNTTLEVMKQRRANYEDSMQYALYGAPEYEDEEEGEDTDYFSEGYPAKERNRNKRSTAEEANTKDIDDNYVQMLIDDLRLNYTPSDEVANFDVNTAEYETDWMRRSVQQKLKDFNHDLNASALDGSGRINKRFAILTVALVVSLTAITISLLAVRAYTASQAAAEKELLDKAEFQLQELNKEIIGLKAQIRSEENKRDNARSLFERLLMEQRLSKVRADSQTSLQVAEHELRRVNERINEVHEGRRRRNVGVALTNEMYKENVESFEDFAFISFKTDLRAQIIDLCIDRSISLLDAMDVANRQIELITQSSVPSLFHGTCCNTREEEEKTLDEAYRLAQQIILADFLKLGLIYTDEVVEEKDDASLSESEEEFEAEINTPDDIEAVKKYYDEAEDIKQMNEEEDEDEKRLIAWHSYNYTDADVVLPSDEHLELFKLWLQGLFKHIMSEANLTDSEWMLIKDEFAAALEEENFALDLFFCNEDDDPDRINEMIYRRLDIDSPPQSDDGDGTSTRYKRFAGGTSRYKRTAVSVLYYLYIIIEYCVKHYT